MTQPTSPARSAPLPQVFVSNHATRVDASVIIDAQYAVSLQFRHPHLDLPRRRSYKSPDVVVLQWPPSSPQAAVVVAGMHQAHKLDPEPPGAEGAQLQPWVIPPVGRVELEGWALRRSARSCARP